MFDILNIVKAMSDENRLRIIMALRGKELCVCTLTELLQLAPSTTSKHLSILKQARLIESVKESKFVYYRLTMPESPGYALVGSALEWAQNALKDTPQIKSDEVVLQNIIDKGIQSGSEVYSSVADRRLYRHVPGIHAIGDFGGK